MHSRVKDTMIPGLLPARRAAAAWFTYYIIPEPAARLAFAAMLFMPVAFYYAHSAKLASGVLSFAVIANSYFLHRLRTRDPDNLAIAFLIAGLAFLYKRLLGSQEWMDTRRHACKPRSR